MVPFRLCCGSWGAPKKTTKGYPGATAQTKIVPSPPPLELLSLVALPPGDFLAYSLRHTSKMSRHIWPAASGRRGQTQSSFKFARCHLERHPCAGSFCLVNATAAAANPSHVVYLRFRDAAPTETVYILTDIFINAFRPLCIFYS